MDRGLTRVKPEFRSIIDQDSALIAQKGFSNWGEMT
jgi:hypothetical protein